MLHIGSCPRIYKKQNAEILLRTHFKFSLSLFNGVMSEAWGNKRPLSYAESNDKCA